MKKTWDVNVNGVAHTIEYKTGFGGAKILVNGVSYKAKSKNWWIVMIDYPVVIDGTELRVVVIGNKVRLAVNGIYQGSGEAYVPLNKMPALSNVFLGISCLGGATMGGWLCLIIGLLFGFLYIKLGLEGKIKNVVVMFVICTIVQILYCAVVIWLRQQIGI